MAQTVKSKRYWMVLGGAVVFGVFALGAWTSYPGWSQLLAVKYAGCGQAPPVFPNPANQRKRPMSTQTSIDALTPHWTRSYVLYPHPHAIWLSRYEFVGVNAPALDYILKEATLQKKPPELVVYSIPDRDMGQSSAGGFKTYVDYMADNQATAAKLGNFTRATGLKPRIYLEPDALGHAITYRRERGDDSASVTLYNQRTQALGKLISLYTKAGCQVYLDAAHSGWFDYGDADIDAMASALNASGIAHAHGIVSNISNRQSLEGGQNTENHYLRRLLPKLANKHLDVVVDTSRNGKSVDYFKARQYTLLANGTVSDNEVPSGRYVVSWQKNAYGELWIRPFFGKSVLVSILTRLDKYSFDAGRLVLTAPPWLDPIGDVVLGKSPADTATESHICRYRHIKPPDDCDGSINCPAGESRYDIQAETAKRQI